LVRMRSLRLRQEVGPSSVGRAHGKTAFAGLAGWFHAKPAAPSDRDLTVPKTAKLQSEGLYSFVQ
jgi:hypothetical protein